MVPELIRNGHVPTPGIGIVAGSEALATRVGVEGVLVVRTVPGSPAARAGLHGVNTTTGEVGDIIVAANDAPVRRLADLTDQLEALGVGKTAHLTLRRAGNNAAVDVDIVDVSQER